MKIGLIDVDGHNGHPNLALMKLSAYHKARGDSVEWYEPIMHSEDNPMDRVYMSKVFTFEPDYPYYVFAKEIIKGGTGYKDYGSLPDEVEAMFPDYSIYPKCTHAIGFLTRGCIRACPWCVVPKKEGHIRPAATWQEIKRPDSREIVFLDNNVLACEHGLKQIEDMGGKPVWVDFNQGLDARLIDADVAKLLARLHWIKYIRLSCDTSAMIPVIQKATEHMLKAGIAKSRFWSYALVQDVKEAHERVMALECMGVNTFAQPYRDYDGGEPTAEQKDFARWVNNKAVFRSCTWEDYNRRGK